MSNQNNVIVVWGYNPDDQSFHTVSFSNGKSRIYEKDKLDARLGELPYCATLDEAKEQTKNKGPGVAVQLAYTAAEQAGLL